MRIFYRHIAVTAILCLLPLMALAKTGSILPSQVIFTMPQGHFFENIAVGPDKAFYITDYTGKAIYRYTTGTGLTLLTTVDAHPVSLRFNREGNGLLAVHKTPIFAGPAFVKSMALYTINTKGELNFLKDVPEASFLNGMTMLSEDSYLLGDAIKGIIWKVDINDGSISTWMQSDLLIQENPGGHIPGVNGIQIYGNDFFAVNGDKALILHATINNEGNPTPPVILHKEVVVDDFVVDDNRTIYATTHGDTVLKIGSDGSILSIATKDQGVTGSTAAQFGADIGDANSLYVITDGGLIFGDDSGAKLVRISLLQ